MKNLADDNPAMRALIRQRFLSGGFNTCADAGNEIEALEVAAKCKPDIIVLGLAMPLMNGIQTAPKLKEVFPAVPIILFTLYGNQLISSALPIAISAVVSKEYLEALFQTAQELIGT